MRLALKFAAVLVAVISVLLAVQAVLHVRRIAELQENETRGDVVLLTRSLTAALEELWTVAGRERAMGFLARADARRPGIELQLVESLGPGAPIPPAETVTVDRIQRDGASLLRATAPILIDGETRAFLRLDRHLLEGRQYLRTVLWTQVGTTIVAVIVSALMALWLGLRLIGRPIRQLSAFATAVADGDFSVKTDTGRHDEIGQLARQLNAMAIRLAQSQERIREESRARTAAHEQLRHADRLSTVGKIASSMAHELGTPLNVVSGRAAMLVGDPALSEEARGNARIITEQARRMAGIIRSLLDFSRRKTLEREDVRLEDLLLRAKSLLEPITDHAGVAVDVDAGQQLIARIDVGKTLQVLTNLMMNSIHAMPNGGRILLTASQEHVDEPADSHASSGDYVCLAVEDTGRGIPESELGDIFKPFFTTKKPGKGTGLGLSVCHSIIREHGGWIDVKSQQGSGSQFAIYLPEGEQP